MVFEFNTYCFPSALAAAIVLSSLCMALKNLKAGRRVWVLCFLLSQLFFCMVCESLLVASTTPEQTLFWDRMMYIPIILIPGTLNHIMMHYLPGQKPKLWVYLPAVLFLSLTHTDLLLAGVEQTYWGWGKVVGPMYPAFKTYFGSFAICFYVSLCYAIAVEKSARLKNELLCLAAATIPTVLIGMLILLVLPLHGITAGNIILNALCAIYSSLVLTYSMLNKRLFDLYLALPVIGARRQMEKRRIKESIENLAMDGYPLLSYEAIIEKIKGAFNVDVSIENGDGIFTNKNCRSKFGIQQCLDFSKSQNNLIIRHELPKRSTEHNILLQHGIEMIIPLYAGRKLLAVICFGTGISDIIYSPSDLELLLGLCNRLKMVISYLSYSKNISSVLKQPCVIVYKAEGEIYSVKKRGNVNVAIVDYDHKDIKYKM